MKKDLKGQLWIGIVCVILGFMITMQIKSVFYNNANSVVMQRSDALLSELNNQKATNAVLREQIVQMKAEIDSYRNNAGGGSDIVKSLTEQLKLAEILAGTSAVEGSGIIVTLNDSQEKSTTNPESFIIHDEDLRKVINELFSAGAEAISINDERLITTSSIRCVGPTILINGNKYAPPFEIRAIGNAETLKAAMNMRGGVVDILKSLWKIEVDIKEADKVVIPEYTGAQNFKYANTAKE